MPHIIGLRKKKGDGQLVTYTYLRFGLETTVKMLEEVKDLGFRFATKAGLSIGIDDMVMPDNKKTLVKDAEKQVVAVQQQYLDGAITNGERYNKVIEIWSAITEKVADKMFGEMQRRDKEGDINPIYVMADSGARGSKQQIRQLSGMRGLMAKPSGEIIEAPITANFREGLTVLQYFISTHGARKGLADTRLKPADSGYLTRRLVDVAQDVIISEYDCGTVDGIYVAGIVEAGEIIEPLRDRIVGRVSLEKIKDYDGNVIVDINNEITEELAGAIQAAGIERVKIRSVLTCESKRGVCVMCYGRNLASGRLVELGEATGVIAAQSIGEPGTQLTMRTFDIGGTASRGPAQSRQPAIVVKGKSSKRYLMPSRSHLMVQDGDTVSPGDVLAKIPRETTKTKDITGGLPRVVELFEARKPHETAVISEIDGTVKFGEVAKGQRKLYVQADNGTEKEYSVPRGVHINVQEGERVRAGEPLMDGPLNPHDILAVLGEKELQAYLVNEIQEVYRLQGVNISDKHIEVIVRQMMRWRKVEDVGDTKFLLEEQVDKFAFAEENERVIKEGGRPATGRPLLLGITKASLSTDSFISAASFQETTRVLTEASIQGKVDHLRGLKENVIVGRLIPAGTGMEYYRNVRLSPEMEEAAANVHEEVSAAYDKAERALELMRHEGETEELTAE